MPPRRLLVGDEAEVVAAYAGGETVEALAERYGCSTTTIRQVLEGKGQDRRARGPRSPLEGKEQQVADAYRRGATVRDLVDRFGANQRTIRKALKDQGVEMRPPGRRPEPG